MSRAAKLYRATAVPMTRGVNTARGQSRGNRELPGHAGPAEAWGKLGEVQPGFSTAALAPVATPRPGAARIAGLTSSELLSPAQTGAVRVKLDS